jgi:rRNA biogenesis protein RRP5
MFKDLAEGQLLHGYISNVGSMGAFVQLSGLLTGRVQLKELSERFITNPQDHFKVGQLLPVRVIKLNAEKGTIELTAKRSVVSAANVRVMEMLKPGMVIKGRVTKVVADLGVFIAIKHCTLRGLAYKTECVDNKSVDFSSHYVVGDKVKAVVLRVNPTTQKISLGLKASLFQKLDNIAAAGRSHEDADDMVDEDEALEEQAKYSEDEESSEDEFEERDVAPRSSPAAAAKPLAVQTKRSVDVEAEAAPSLFSSLVFNAPAAADDEEEDEEELVPMDGDEEADVLSRRAAKEREIERSERAIMDESKPQSSEEHEMSCVRTPNNSYVWIQYMAYELSQGNTAQARDIANRALKAISVHETQERWNIWASMLSLENVYGTVDSINDVVKRAQKLNNPLKVQLELARIYDMSNKVERAADAYSVAARRWGSDFNDHAVEIWTLWCGLLFKYARVEEARKVLTQAIQKLNAKYHAPVLIKFAQLEFQDSNGSPDRARLLLEKYLSAHSKRLDVWVVYVDQEIKHARTLAAKVNAKPGDVKKAKGRIRALLDRLTAESQWKVWTVKQMKFIFKKYLDCEEELGTPDRVAAVQDKARLYVSSLNA